jgi:pimeloyl-ACP methyl ester carboxylesterase
MKTQTPLVNLFLIVSLIIFSLADSHSQVNCDDSYAPVVFVHGFLASGDTWTTQIQRFASNGHCQDRYFAFDWNTLSAGGADDQLDELIDAVLASTEAEGVHLVGHSAGGGRGYSYLSDPDRAAKVISYAHVGSNTESGPAGPGGSVPTINIWSQADQIVDGGDIPGAENVMFTDLDHYQVATSAMTFEKIYDFFYGSLPSTTAIQPATEIEITGRCITLGENRPTRGAQVEIFACDDEGRPLDPSLGTFDIGDDGNWGPIEVDPNTYYMFKITSGAQGFRKVIYYYEPFVRDNPTVYLRTFPSPFSLAGLLLAAVPNSDDQSVISVFSSTQAVIHGRDQLSINGIDLAHEDLAPADESMIALFCYDDDNDGQGNGDPLGAFALVPFLQGADVPIATDPQETWNIEFNGSKMPVLNWRSQSDGVVIAVFNEPVTITSTHPSGNLELLLEAWPNPGQDEVRLSLEGTTINPADMNISDIMGRPIHWSGTALDNGEILLNTSALKNGVYLISIIKGERTISKQLVINR